MSELVKAGSVDRFRKGRGRRVMVEGKAVAVFLDGDRAIAVGDRCPHMGASLSEGKLEEGRVVCSWHGWSFDGETGQCDRKDWARVPRYEAQVQAGEVLVRALGDDPSQKTAGGDPQAR